MEFQNVQLKKPTLIKNQFQKTNFLSFISNTYYGIQKFDAINYESNKICSSACKLGDEMQVFSI